ncbi:MAG: ABC transporter permease, partial [Acidobacteriota bacterium]|nr:ABC transporter permease [Acidobacteriota bacterium]
GWIAAEQLARDVRFGARTLRKSPGFTVMAIATLALGIGVNAAIFTVTKAVLFAGFPLVEHNDRIVYLTSGRGCCVSYPDYEDWRAQARSFTDLAIVHGVLSTFSDNNVFARSCDATEVSANTFSLVGPRPVMGRDFTPSDEVPGAAPVVMLSYGFWERVYGKDPAILGHIVRINGTPTAVIGIMPRGFSFPQKQDLWVPLIPTPEIRKRDARGAWFVFGRLNEGVTLLGARAEMEGIGRRLGSAYPRTNQGRNLIPYVQNFNEFFFFENENVVYRSMWGAVGFVLLIACANLANMVLVRTMARAREISLRIALGAGRWRIVRQLLIESLMLSAAGGTLGWWIARWAVHAYELADRGPGRASWRILDYTLDYHVLAYLIAISAGTALLCGLAPALSLSKLDVNAALKDGGRGATEGGRKKSLAAILVTGEIALAVVLLAGAGVMMRSFLNIYSADPGVRTQNILTVSVGLPAARYPRPEMWVSFFERLKTRLRATPGVESVTMADRIPTDRVKNYPYELSGAAPVDEQRRPTLSALLIGPDYFRTLGAAVLSGREFTEADGISSSPVALVNQRFAAAFWPGKAPLGQRLRLFNGNTPDAWLTVIGVVPNIAQNGALRAEAIPLVYRAWGQKPTASTEVMARTRIAPAGLANTFRREIQALDSDLPLFGPFSLAERLEANYWTRGLYGVLFLIFAAIALLLASLGLYAVVAQSVSRRTQEIGIRIAIGATVGDIRRLVLTQGMLPLAIGLAMGMAAALALTPILKSFLVQVSPADPLTFVVAPVVLILAAALGCLIPARR